MITYKVIRTIVLTVALLSASVPSLAQTDSVEQVTKNSVRSVITDQLSAFQSGDHNRAFSHAAPKIKGIFGTVDKFIGMVKGGYPALYAPDYYAYGRNTEFNGEVYQEVLVTDGAGKQWQAVYTLKKQADGSWKITGVKIEPHKGAST